MPRFYRNKSSSIGWVQPSASPFACVALILMILLFGPSPMSSFNHIFSKGSQLSCSEEGEVVVVPFLKKDPCITCVCLNSVINCFKDTCPESHNCYYHLANSTDKCCTKCKGCSFNGKYLNNGETVQDPHDVCQAFQCHSGALTSHRTECHVPCSNPISIRGQCCPSCNVCPRRNTKDGQEVIHVSKDLCIKCHCFKGQLICTRKVCPVLPCSKSNWIKPFNSCCPICKGKKDSQKSDPQSCLLGETVYRDKAEFKYDECTSCVCRNATAICSRQTCPSLQCEENKQIRADGQCCPSCALASTAMKMCYYKSRTYKDKEWWDDTCQKCTCRAGKVHCSAQPCPGKIVCPSGYQKMKMNGDCCETCAQVGASCHVRDAMNAITTFDGKRYRFEGKCNYVLTRDCQTKQFSIHMLNKFRKSTDNSSGLLLLEGTSLMVKIEGTRINLSHLGGVRVNRSQVALPFIELGHFTIAKFDNRIKLRATKMEFEVLWVANISVEVKVKNKHYSRLCGLCGNFNGDIDDEFKLKNSKRIAILERFAKSFEVGQNLLCPKNRSLRKKSMQQQEQVSPMPSSLMLMTSERICERIKARNPHCRGHPSSEGAFEQCVQSMAACDGDKYCECRALEGFIQGCDSRNDHPSQQQKASSCKRQHCPPGSEFRMCSYSCKKTCKNRARHQGQCSRKCRSGCVCIGNRVWHRNQCIPEVMCP